MMKPKARTGTTGEVIIPDEVQYASGELSQSLDGGLSAQALLSSMRRHWGIVLALSLGLCIVGAFIGLGLPAWFQAESVLVIHARPQRLAGVQELPDPVPDAAVIHSEVDTLQSRSVIEPVVRSLGLWRLPEFQKREYPGGWSWQTLQARVQELWGNVTGSYTTSPPTRLEVSPIGPDDRDPVSQAQIDDAVKKYDQYLYITTDNRSNTIFVGYRSWSPEQAAAIVNAHVKSYQNFEQQGKLTAINRANTALNSQITELRKQLQGAEAAVSRYREEHHLTGAAKDSAALNSQLANLNSQLIAARAELAENEARAARIGLAGNGGQDSIPEVINNATIQALRSQEGKLVAREADLANYHGDAYPKLQQVRASLRKLRDQIGREIARGHSAALQLVERSRTRERSIQQSITELTKRVNSSDAGLQQLQGNADSIKNLLREFEKREEETAADPALIAGNSTLVSRANPTATLPSRKAPMLAFGGGFVGLTLGGLLAVFLEFRDKTFRTSSQVEQQIGSLRVGATPRATGRGRKSPADIVLNDNGSLVAEAFRLSWANIQLAIEEPRAAAFGIRRSGVALGITSAATGEGKSTHALAFARTAALAGERVVLIDADLRRSGVSGLLKQQFRFTLKDYLQGRCAADDTLAVEEHSGVHFVPSRPADGAWTSQDLKRFSDFVDYLKHQFAIVIIDLPPVLGLAETIRLSVAADSIALVIRWGRTERQMVQFAQDTLGSAGASASAAILNDIDVKAQQRRGYRDRTIVYSDEGLYRTAPGRRVAQPLIADMDAHPAMTAPEREDHREEERYRPADPTPADGPETPASSDIEKLYNRYRHG